MWLSILYWFLLILYVPACLGLIVLVLLQKGKGTGFAGAFGAGGGSEAVFGPRASRSLPVRLTYIFATTFMVIALIMSLISGDVGKGNAPDLAVVDAAAVSSAGGPTALDDLGLGTGHIDPTRQSAAPTAQPANAVSPLIVETTPVSATETVPEDAEPAPDATTTTNETAIPEIESETAAEPETAGTPPSAAID